MGLSYAEEGLGLFARGDREEGKKRKEEEKSKEEKKERKRKEE